MEFVIFRKIIQGKLLTTVNHENLLARNMTQGHKYFWFSWINETRNGWCTHPGTGSKMMEALSGKLFLNIFILNTFSSWVWHLMFQALLSLKTPPYKKSLLKSKAVFRQILWGSYMPVVIWCGTEALKRNKWVKKNGSYTKDNWNDQFKHPWR